MNLYKDYQLVGDTLFKFNVDDNKHLIWKFGGVPCIDASNVWDRYGKLISKIIIRTKKGRLFKIDRKTFDTNKQEIDFGFGKQYYVDKDLWEIKEAPEAPPQQTLPMPNKIEDNQGLSTSYPQN